MLPTKIVIHEMKRLAVCVVLDLLEKRIRQPRKPTHGHAHGQLVALDVTSRDMCALGLPEIFIFLVPVHSNGLYRFSGLA